MYTINNFVISNVSYLIDKANSKTVVYRVITNVVICNAMKEATALFSIQTCPKASNSVCLKSVVIESGLKLA